MPDVHHEGPACMRWFIALLAIGMILLVWFDDKLNK
jgi:hypothetical protein